MIKTPRSGAVTSAADRSIGIRCLRGRHRFEIMPPALIPSEEDLWETLFSGAFPIYEKCAACGDARRRTMNQS